MQFVVPQFIEVENKIIGPISARQFIIMMVGGALIFVLYKLAPTWFLIVGSILIVGLVIVFAFAKVNSQPFHWFFLNLIQSVRRPHLRLWYKEIFEFKERIPKSDKKGPEFAPRPKIAITNSRLAEMSLLVDTGGAYQQSDLPPKPPVLPPTTPTK